MKYIFDINKKSENNYEGYVSVSYNNQARTSVREPIYFTITNGIAVSSEPLSNSLLKVLTNTRLTEAEHANAKIDAAAFVKYCCSTNTYINTIINTMTNTATNTTTNSVVAL